MSMTFLAILGLNCGLTTAELNDHAEALSVPVKFTYEANLRTHSGFLPVLLGGAEAGVETYFIENPDFLDSLPPNEAIDKSNAPVVQFRFGGNLKEGATALYIGYILAEKCQAILFEPEGGDYMAPVTAKQGAEAMASYE